MGLASLPNSGNFIEEKSFLPGSIFSIAFAAELLRLFSFILAPEGATAHIPVVEDRRSYWLNVSSRTYRKRERGEDTGTEPPLIYIG